MDNPVEGIVKVEGEASGSAAVTRPAGSQGRSPAPAPEIAHDSVDISAAAQAAAEASARALKVQAQTKESAGQAAAAAKDSEVQSLAPNISFNYNKEVGILQAAVVDPTTHKVIRQIPPDEVLRMGLRFRNLVKQNLEAAHKVSGQAPAGFESGGEGDGGEQAA